MDYQQDMDATRPPAQRGHSENMATAALILGMTAVLTCPCIYAALICGSLGIIFALLSKGGKTTISRRGTTGLILSSVGLILTIVIYAIAFALMLSYYGGFDGLIQEYMKLYDANTLEELYQNMGI